jgi:Ca2+-binding RTX toxin-like protein
MTKTLLITLTALIVVPSAASAATATADIERRQGAPLGPVTFKAAKGEVNRVTVTAANGRLRFQDERNRVRAKGDCEQVNARTAICPFTEDIAKVKLADRADRAKAEGLVEVRGGSGADVLRGSGGVDMLDGQKGSDTLRGGSDNDYLTGGPGGDRLFGGGGDDDLVDGESDAQATPDLFVGGRSRDTRGADRGDLIDFSQRRRALDIDLARVPVAARSMGDDIHGIESVEGGAGDDRLVGDGDDNWLEGNGGKDRIRARGGADIPMGGEGNDTVRGDGGDDVVWGNGGTDLLFGGSGDDLMDGDDANAESVSCGPGDDDARVTRLDTVADCEIATKGNLYVGVQPQVNGNEATFRVACQQLGGCSGTLTLTGPNGEDFGSGSFSNLPDDPQTFSDVAVTLTPAAVAALQPGVTVQVAFGNKGGYRALMQAS